MHRLTVRVVPAGLGDEAHRVEKSLRRAADVGRVGVEGLVDVATSSVVDVLVVGLGAWRAARERLPGDLGPRPAVILVRSAGEPWVSPDELGADDEVSAPVHPDEIVWRVLDVARRRTQRARLERTVAGLPTLVHDLRAPVSGALIRLDLLRRGSRGALAEGVRTDLARIERCQRDLVLMLGDLGELGAPDTGTERFPPGDLGRVVADVVRDVRSTASAGAVTLDLRGPVEPVPCRIDQRRLRHALLTLLSNALSFTPEGGRVTVDVVVGTGCARVTITDGGSPLAPGVLDRVFEPRARALDEAHHVAGSGLGLSLVRRIAEAHHGTVGAEARGDVGMRFWIELPLATAACPV